MKKFGLFISLILLFFLYSMTPPQSREESLPFAVNDTASIKNQSLPDEVVYVEIDFLANDKAADKSKISTQITRQSNRYGKAYLVENNSLMVYYPDEKRAGTDTIYYKICNSQDRCSNAKVLVHVIDPNKVDLIIPSAFSPNNDGKNDKFYIKGIENYPQNELIVFSRWGTKVYACSNYSNNNAWEGGYKNAGIKLGPGDKLPKGTYFYKLIVKDKGAVKSGYVVIKY